MILYFKKERDREFFDTCERLRKNGLSLEDAAKKAITLPASSFFLTDKGFERIINYTGDVVGIKCELYKEVKLRANQIQCKTVKQTIRILETQTAPRFYISESRAISLYYELIKQYRDEVRCRINFYNRVFNGF